MEDEANMLEDVEEPLISSEMLSCVCVYFHVCLQFMLLGVYLMLTYL